MGYGGPIGCWAYGACTGCCLAAVLTNAPGTSTRSGRTRSLPPPPPSLAAARAKHTKSQQPASCQGPLARGVGVRSPGPLTQTSPSNGAHGLPVNEGQQALDGHSSPAPPQHHHGVCSMPFVRHRRQSELAPSSPRDNPIPEPLVVVFDLLNTETPKHFKHLTPSRQTASREIVAP